MKKLNTRGITHILAPLAVIVVVASVGTFVAVRSHADPVSTAKPAVTYPCTHYEYGSGGSGTCVKYIQEMLNDNTDSNNSSGPFLTLDGSFGPITLAAVKNFQATVVEWAGEPATPKLTADGIVGPMTWKKLCENTSFAEVDYSYASGANNTYTIQGSNAAKAAGCVSTWGYKYYY